MKYLSILFLFSLLGCNEAYERDYKYRISYSEGKWSMSDFANEIVDKGNGCIEYYEVREHRNMRRCGDYSIREY